MVHFCQVRDYLLLQRTRFQSGQLSKFRRLIKLFQYRLNALLYFVTEI